MVTTDTTIATECGESDGRSNRVAPTDYSGAATPSSAAGVHNAPQPQVAGYPEFYGMQPLCLTR
jgi:hypothetical protein